MQPELTIESLSGEGWMEPGEQGTHSGEAAESAYLPAEQAVQKVVPEVEDSPTAQEVHEVEPRALLNVPFSQAPQVLAPVTAA